MADWTECPNGCGEKVKADWVHPEGCSWGGEVEPYVVPRQGDFHLMYDCPGSFESGGAVLGGLVMMAEAIRGHRTCPTCGAGPDGPCYGCLRNS